MALKTVPSQCLTDENWSLSRYRTDDNLFRNKRIQVCIQTGLRNRQLFLGTRTRCHGTRARCKGTQNGDVIWLLIQERKKVKFADAHQGEVGEWYADTFSLHVYTGSGIRRCSLL